MNKTDFAELKEKLFKQSYTQTTAIISELIEIIKLQSVTIDSICTTHSDDCTDADEEFSEDETCECGYISIVNNKKETTTRLQKLRDGNNGNTTN